MMTFLKNNLISLIALVVMIGLLVVGLLGMGSDKVEKAMQSKISAAGQIDNLKRNAKNEAVIAAEEKRIQALQQEVERAQNIVKDTNLRGPLIPEVFPGPASSTRRFAYKDAYLAEFDKLVRSMGGGGLPTAAELQEAEQDIAERLELEREKAAEGGAAAAPIGEQEPRPTPPPPPGGAPGFPQPGGLQPPGGFPQSGAGGEKPKDPRFDPPTVARVKKAQDIRIYVDFVNALNQQTFHISPIVRSTQPPAMSDLWLAQMGLWIQSDIVAAIARTNTAAVERLPAEAEPNVTNLPVKRLDEILIDGYVLPENKTVEFPRDASSAGGGGGGGLGASSGGRTGAGLGGDAAASFTQRVSDADFDVVRFSISVVVDQRDLLRLIDELSKSNLYQMVDCDYVVVDSKEAEAGYLYGTDPVIRARLQFEGYFVRTLYDPLMPTDVRAALGGGGQ